MQNRIFTQTKEVESFLGSIGKRKSQKNLASSVKDVSKKSKIGNSENLENQNSEKIENGKTAEMKNTTSAISENADSEIKYIKKILGLPEDATLAEVRQTFDVKKNSLNDYFKVSFEKTLQKAQAAS